jgi:hypothetical protein
MILQRREERQKEDTETKCRRANKCDGSTLEDADSRSKIINLSFAVAVDLVLF